MKGLLLVIVLSCPFFSRCFNFSIPLQAALLVRGEPVGFGDGDSIDRTKRAVEEEATELPCAGDEYPHPLSSHCCKKCLSGFKRISHCPEKGKITECTPCPKDQFIDVPNYSKWCHMCTQCIPSLGQTILSACTRERDTICGCPPGQFKIMVGSTFKCENCSQCLNGKILVPCKENNDTVCTCHYEYFLDHSKRTCEPCRLCNSGECLKHCPPLQGVKVPQPEDAVWQYVVPPAGLLVLIAIAIACYIYKKRSRPEDVSETEVQADKLICQTTTPEDSSAFASIMTHTGEIIGRDVAIHCQALPLPDVTTEPRAQLFQKPGELYALIDIIPVSRWREFVRRLGLSDNDIEKSEEENRRFREAQYDMLITWRNRAGPSGATKDVVSRVLKDMELGGCLERFLECQ